MFLLELLLATTRPLPFPQRTKKEKWLMLPLSASTVVCATRRAMWWLGKKTTSDLRRLTVLGRFTTMNAMQTLMHYSSKPLLAGERRSVTAKAVV
jgi:hypothetical protein